jgi:transglutaminase-like putative cysteine protease
MGRKFAMSFATYFKASSYAMIAVAMLALMLAGGLHVGLAAVFAAIMVVAWKLEGTKWQLSERVGLAVVLLSIPLFLLDWKYQRTIGEAPGRMGVNALAHLIVFLSAIKLLQVKSDRDWVFLYLISFFELLLAAGLSFSPIFLLTLILYLFCSLSTVIAFEIRKAQRRVKPAETRLLVPPDSRIFRKLVGTHGKRDIEASRLPFAAASLLVLIFILGLPLFFVAPRAGSAVISRGGGGLTNFIGFSESVKLGEIGDLKQNNQVVMRVRIEGPNSVPESGLKWRGVGLDEFTGLAWKKSSEARRTQQKPIERGFFHLGTTDAPQGLTRQTVFLEPISSNVLFAAPRALAIQGDFPFVRVDSEGSIQSRPHDLDRIMYTVISDTSQPDPETLRRDLRPYSASEGRYQDLPVTPDRRVADYARATILKAGARNRYDKAKAIETELRNNYGYSLQMRAGGEDPLSDFLFNIRAGHCEYFSTAMAVMLRTQEIAARVVNGFLPGEYNEAAGAYTVRQSDAHSWVEVYFPETKSWVTFDPTPAAGRTEPQSVGLAAQLGKYAEALELIWFQYVVGYDKQEQRSLAASLHNRVFDYRRLLGEEFADFKKSVLPIATRILVVVALIAGVPLIVVLARRVRRFGWRRALRLSSAEPDTTASAIEFYERLLAVLAARGIKRSPDQTPREFAAAFDMIEAVEITHAYNRARFGGEQLSSKELMEIDRSLNDLEAATAINAQNHLRVANGSQHSARQEPDKAQNHLR